MARIIKTSTAAVSNIERYLQRVTASTLQANNTAAGNETLLQLGSGHYAAMGRKSAALRKQTPAR